MDRTKTGPEIIICNIKSWRNWEFEAKTPIWCIIMDSKYRGNVKKRCLHRRIYICIIISILLGQFWYMYYSSKNKHKANFNQVKCKIIINPIVSFQFSSAWISFRWLWPLPYWTENSSYTFWLARAVSNLIRMITDNQTEARVNKSSLHQTENDPIFPSITQRRRHWPLLPMRGQLQVSWPISGHKSHLTLRQ